MGDDHRTVAGVSEHLRYPARVVPSLGYDITFLNANTSRPASGLLMIPWFICGIALFVEVNFRGFIWGDCRIESQLVSDSYSSRRWSPLPLGLARSRLRSIHSW